MASPSLAIVTGASEGIGKELARLLAQQGYHLILVARREALLKSLSEKLETDYPTIRAHVLAADLAEANAARLVKAFADTLPHSAEVLINNAGLGTMGDFQRQDAAKVRQMVAVNIQALTELTHLFLPHMVARGKGRILNLASTAAFQPGPGMAVYFASKSYVLSFSEALWWELRNSGVTVTALCPGATASGFQQASGSPSIRLYQKPMPTSAEVAAFGYRAMTQGQRVAIHGSKNRLLASLAALTPRKWALRITERLLRVPDNG